MKKRTRIKLTDKGLIELEKLMKELDNTPYSDTLRASEKLTRRMEDMKEASMVSF